MSDKSKGLYTDFSDEAVQGRLCLSGLPAHLRPGHRTPDVTEKERQALAAIEALRRPLPDDEDDIPHT